VEAKKSELDQFTGRLKDDLSAEVVQQTLAVKVEIHEHAGFTGFKLSNYEQMSANPGSVCQGVHPGPVT